MFGTLVAGVGVIAGSASGTAAIGLFVAAFLTLAAIPLTLVSAELTRHRAKHRRYERLLWDIWTYGVVVLASSSPDDFFTQLTQFTELPEQAGD